MKYAITSFLVILVLVFVQPVSAEGDPVAGKNKSANCMGCHGVKGYFNVYPTYRVPKLGGQHPEYIVASLKAYQDETREHDTCLLYTSPSPRDRQKSRMPSSA